MVKSSEKGIRRPHHKKELAMPYVTPRKSEPAERKAQRERVSIAIEELDRVPRPDYGPAGKR
jgi:hypothetical protein